MIEIRFHGRGGQGAVTAAEILSQALLIEGKYSQYFAEFGIERRGAPVTAFLRIDEKEILLRSKIYNPNMVVIFDSLLIEEVKAVSGLKSGGLLMINSPKIIKRFKDSRDFKMVIVDATKIALENEIGTKIQPIVNTVMVGALAKILGISFESLIEPIKKKFGEKAEKNIKGAKEAYKAIKMVEVVKNEKK